MQKLGLVHVYVARILAKTEYFLTKCDVDNVNVGGRNSDMTRFDIQTEDVLTTMPPSPVPAHSHNRTSVSLR